jgi:hypothetical protein
MSHKGQPHTPEAIEQMKASKLRQFLSKINWNLVDPYLDVELDISSRNRSRQFITIRQYKEFLLSGKSTQDMVRDGVAKNLLVFYSNLAQGKILLTKEIFECDYNAGMALGDMSKKYKITRDDITFLRQLYGLKVKGATFQHRKETEVPLTQRQKEIIYGSLMGDAKRTSPSSAGFGHGTYQMEYLAWKFKEFESVASRSSWKESSIKTRKTGRILKGWRFYTHANSDIEKIIRQFYISGTKQVTREILDNLTPLSIAVWFQDDGKTDFFHRMKINKNVQYNFTPMPVFCTESFSLDSCNAIKTWFLEKYGIEVRLKQRTKGKEGHRVIVCNQYVRKFFDLIRPHVLPMFRYKIDCDANLEWRRIRALRP